MNYKELVKTFHERQVDEASVEEINCEAYEYLKHADPRAYALLEDKLTKLAYAISRPQAEVIVRNMRPQGQVWSYEQVEELVRSKGINDCFVDWYLVMNMCYNDYFNTAKIYGLQNDANFYFNLAKDFIEDPDASPHKVSMYFVHE